VYEVQDLRGTRSEAHSCRIRFYDGGSWTPTEEVLTQYLHDATALEVKAILDIRHDTPTTEPELLIDWRGLDASWEPLSTMMQDIPDLVRPFLETSQHPDARHLFTRFFGHSESAR